MFLAFWEQQRMAHSTHTEAEPCVPYRLDWACLQNPVPRPSTSWDSGGKDSSVLSVADSIGLHHGVAVTVVL